MFVVALAPCKSYFYFLNKIYHVKILVKVVDLRNRDIVFLP